VALVDHRDPAKVRHTTLDLLRQRAYQIACGYEDAIDGNAVRHDAGFQIALNRVPDADSALASQPTLSRFEVRRAQELIEFSNTLGDLWIERLRAQAVVASDVFVSTSRTIHPLRSAASVSPAR
jgi:hypothetical protein